MELEGLTSCTSVITALPPLHSGEYLQTFHQANSYSHCHTPSLPSPNSVADVPAMCIATKVPHFLYPQLQKVAPNAFLGKQPRGLLWGLLGPGILTDSHGPASCCPF